MRRIFFRSLLSAVIVASFFAISKENSNAVTEVNEDLNSELMSTLKLVDDDSFTIHEEVDITTEDLVDVIVEFKQKPAEVQKLEAKLKAKSFNLKKAAMEIDEIHQKFIIFVDDLQKQRNSSEKIVITNHYKHTYNGVSMSLPGKLITELISFSDLKRIWVDEVVNVPLQKLQSERYTMRNNDFIKASDVQDLGITGKGVSVGVIDTGIDYNHPDLQSSYQGFKSIDGESRKVKKTDVKGWDFVDNDADPMETTYIEWQNSNQPEYNALGSSYYTSHGTHVSGTIAASPQNQFKEYAATGIAPDVSLYGYRVLGAYGSGSTANVLAAMEKALLDEMDIVNLSLGSANSHAIYPTSMAANYLVLNGIVTVVASGNNGPGKTSLSTPGTSPLAISVGATTYDQAFEKVPFTYSDKKAILDVYAYSKKADYTTLLENQYEYEVVNYGYVDEYDKLDMTNKIAVVKRGMISFYEKALNAKKAGALAVIIYNNFAGDINAYAGLSNIALPTFLTTNVVGEGLVANDSKLLQFAKLEKEIIEGGLVADFSSRGPVALTFDIKPDVVAPGVAIYSTLPYYSFDPKAVNDYTNAYGLYNGTSMATPHVSGVAALMLSANHDLKPADLKIILMNSAMKANGDYSVFAQGAGIIDALKAVKSDVLISAKNTVPNLISRDDDYFDSNYEWIDYYTGSISIPKQYKSNKKNQETIFLKIANNGNKKKTFISSFEFHDEKVAAEDGKINQVKIKILQKFSVGKNEQRNLQAKIIVPKTAAAGMYEGYLKFSEVETNKTYRIPFAFKVIKKGITLHNSDAEYKLANVAKKEYGRDPRLYFRAHSPFKEVTLFLARPQTDDFYGVSFHLSKSGKKANMPFFDDVFHGDSDYYIPIYGYMKRIVMINESDFKIINQGVPIADSVFDYVLRVTDIDGIVYEERLRNQTISNESPKMVVKNGQDQVLTSRVIEVSEEMLKDKSYNLQVNLLDLLGSEYNTMHVYNYRGKQADFYPQIYRTDANSNITIPISETEIKTNQLTKRLMPLSRTWAGSEKNSVAFGFVEQGAAYVESTYAKQSMMPKTSNTLTVRLNNVTNFKGASFKLATTFLQEKLYQIKRIEFSDEFKQYAIENNLKLEKAPLVNEGDFTLVSGNVVDGDFLGFSGDINFLDITFTTNDKFNFNQNFEMLKPLQVEDFTYTKANSLMLEKLFTFNLDNLKLVSNQSMVYSYIHAEAFLTANMSNDIVNYDFSKLPLKIYAKNAQNKKYHARVDKYGLYEIFVPVDGENNYQLILSVPGHLTRAIDIVTYFKYDGEIVGLKTAIDTLDYDGSRIYSKAGDLNGDEIIDINDIHIMEKCFNEDKVLQKCDLNLDGVIDEIDVRFIEKNFLSIGELAKKGALAQVVRKQKGLVDYLKDMNLKPLN